MRYLNNHHAANGATMKVIITMYKIIWARLPRANCSGVHTMGAGSPADSATGEGVDDDMGFILRVPIARASLTYGPIDSERVKINPILWTTGGSATVVAHDA
jgi:hypothetical protein